MNRQHWKDILEGIGLIAIVASLAFLAIETRNSTKQTSLNTQAIEIAAYQALMNNIAQANALSVGNADAAAVAAGLYGSSVEEWRRNAVLLTLFLHGDIAYFMFQKGAISEDRLLSALRPLPLASDVGREFWNQRKYVFVDPYRQYIDNLVVQDFWGAQRIKSND